MSVELTFCGSDSDLTRALLTGEIEPDGVDLTAMTEYPPRRHRRFFRHREFDVCEVSLASYVSSRAKPEEYPFTAIPVFPSRRFRHSFFYKHTDVDAAEPADLAGKKVGVQSWQTTANVWLRGIFAEHYGLDLEAVTWVRRREDDVPVELPDRFEIRSLSGGSDPDAVDDPADMTELLFSGELDAAMDPAGSLFHAVADAEEVEFFFDDPKAEEQAYFEETGIHPIMHVIAIRDEVLEEHPWVAVNLYDAFCAARDFGLERARSPSTHMALTWGHIEAARQRQALGAEASVWEYGIIEKTRIELETFLEYAHQQGLIHREVAPEKLFVDSTLSL
ncbi:4,5-dihydroxyphthalate decarboxylase [Halalkaliarchaeum desulfuricum]|uniref:4,5-dihydroxyphthalate decarboxylase n=1 Tax=Halalkaliarchaeum desulfuricum TaxID=2055893 RepID=A0A343TG14_9EURY|nr:ABC transporter substrate-binding protein [Halalkaliarchaeum desulfuricum]AUX08036.1 4,5-dihydroxyphthalate decarboxylase [Halalkaliarchaeum desulfuricum]